MATGGTEKFCFYFLQRRDFENAKYPGGKISPLIYYYNRQGAKWPGARTGNKKSSKSFSDLLLSLAAGGRWVFSFYGLGVKTKLEQRGNEPLLHIGLHLGVDLPVHF